MDPAPADPFIPVPARRTSRLAIASLVAGIFSLCLPIVAGIPAIVCGHLARNRIEKNRAASGEGIALAGLTLGYLSFPLILIYGILAAIAIPGVVTALETAKTHAMLPDALAIYAASESYAAEHDGRSPGSWDELVKSGKVPERILKTNAKFNRTVLLYPYTTDDVETKTVIRMTLPHGKKVAIVNRKGEGRLDRVERLDPGDPGL